MEIAAPQLPKKFREEGEISVLPASTRTSGGGFLGIFFKETEKKETNVEGSRSDWEKLATSLVEAAEGWESYGWEFVNEVEGITITRTSYSETNNKNSEPVRCTKGVFTFSH